MSLESTIYSLYRIFLLWVLYEFPQILSRFKFFETFIFRDSVPTS
ncbi:hypothetical protein LEP1GSC024_0826 [Leptospira noguchii str. 2001034031]|uniref:Uncharacterized protein n=2 Tax=Leptospira noguchii TaxID=28182 RepID=M6Y4G6_9LEPT|nr:hypothetical protein LEP1GSC024_0826 [Leptospira noguchii str. 2001034031]EQA70546.1 hypothetical protein LEP1GSC059_4569 [Leptospira noguchii serovar Panama str. CZ214]